MCQSWRRVLDFSSPTASAFVHFRSRCWRAPPPGLTQSLSKRVAEGLRGVAADPARNEHWSHERWGGGENPVGASSAIVSSEKCDSRAVLTTQGGISYRS